VPSPFYVATRRLADIIRTAAAGDAPTTTTRWHNRMHHQPRRGLQEQPASIDDATVSFTALQPTQGHGNRSTGENETTEQDKIGDPTANFIGHNNVGLCGTVLGQRHTRRKKKSSHTAGSCLLRRRGDDVQFLPGGWSASHLVSPVIPSNASPTTATP
jgi:hypothetical protein